MFYNIHRFHGVMQSKGDSTNRKVNEVLVVSRGPFLTDMGHSIAPLYFFFLLSPVPSPHRLPAEPFLNSVHITEHFTLLNPPSPHPHGSSQCLIQRHRSFVIKGGELEETANPAWELHAGSDSSPCRSARIAEYSQAVE